MRSSLKRVGSLRGAVAALGALLWVIAATPLWATAADEGRYLAIAGNCANCHTAPGGQPFAGGLPINTPFGVIYTSNITPDPRTGLGKWTEQDFDNAMRRGIRPDGAHLYPAFPYTAFTKLSDTDLILLYAYLRTVAPATVTPKPNELTFPFSQRYLLRVWKALFFNEGRFTPGAAKGPEWNRGAYLVEGLGHCGACHTPRNYLGAEQADWALTGGTYTDKVNNGELRAWAAVNLTPAATGLGAWSVDDIAAYLKEGHSQRAVSFGPMNEVIMPSTRYLSSADIRAIAVYLKALGPKERDAVPAGAADLATAEPVYTLRCGTCHQPTGLGAATSAPPLKGSAVVLAADPAALLNAIIYGPQLPEPPPSLAYEKPMAPLGDEMTDEEIAQVATYVRGNWGNRAAPVTVQQVAKQR